MSINRTAASWVAGETPSGAKMQAEIGDLWIGLQAAWTSYTPTWTASTTNPVLGNGTLTGHYLQVGKTIIGRIVLTMGSTTTYGTGGWSLTLPLTTASGASRGLLTGGARDTSANGDYPLFAVSVAGSTALPLRALPTTAGNALAVVSSTVPFAWANTDVLYLDFQYEAA